jgi:hypothetical protein
LTDAVGAGSGRKFDVLRRFDIAVAILVQRVMVTHAQDVRKVQAELALLLTSDQDPSEDWGELRPGPARLTVAVDLPLPPR